MTIHLSLSGGLDSTTLLALAMEEEDRVVPYSFDYGQRHVRELQSADAVAQHYGLDVIPLVLPRLSSPSLTGTQDIPHGHYAADTMVATIVNGRNLMFISTLVSKAEPGDEVWIGVHAGDHAIYPDCRPAFIDPLARAIRAAYDVDLVAPFLDNSKSQIVDKAARLHAPLVLSWSCYEGDTIHCGRCGTCVERAEAFHLAGVHDPTLYRDVDYWRTVVAV